MIVCTKCGFQNSAADSFCGSCGSFLEWTGSKVAEAAPEPVETAPGAQPPHAELERQTFVGRVREAAGLGGAAPAAVEDGAEIAGQAPEPAASGETGFDEARNAAASPPQSAAAATPVVVSGARIYRMTEAPQSPAAPEPEPEPIPAAAPEPEPIPAAAPEPEPIPAPAIAPEPMAAAAPEPEPIPAPAIAPEPEPGAEPGPVIAPEPEPEPIPALAIAPEPEPEPTPAPAIAPEPEPAPVIAPEPEPIPAAEPALPAVQPPAAVLPPAPRIRPAMGGPAGMVQRARPLFEAARPAPPAIVAPVPTANPPGIVPPDQPPAARPVAPPAGQPPAARLVRQPTAPSPVASLPVQPAAVVPAGPTEQPASRQPIAVRPGPEHARQAARPGPAETPPANPGDLICGNCRIGNDPARRFCRRCGQSLAEAVVAVAPRVPWYRRILRRRPVAAAAGERPKSMQTHGRGGRRGLSIGRLLSIVIQVVVVAALVGAVVGYAVVPDWRDGVNSFISSIRQTIAPNLVPVHAAGQATGPGIKGHSAQDAFDGFSNTYWAASVTDGATPTISASFSPPADIAKILITSGAVPDFEGSPRPHEITVEFLDASRAAVASRDLELKDVKDPQVFDVSAKGATTFRLTVRSVYASSGGTNVAITEVEFRVAQ